VGYGFHDQGEPLRPLVKTHPETGRRALYIGRHAHDIPGLTGEESAQLLDRLLDFACQPPRTVLHAWQPGDIAIWDNRALLHRARPYPRNEPRVMVHARVAGDPATESAETLLADRVAGAREGSAQAP
jgi:alpha-ketoglutarate-dependent taurine dioxygenase